MGSLYWRAMQPSDPGNEPHRISVLFLCTGNSCRSQIAEALLRHLGGNRFTAHSAGSHPAGFVHPLATAAMQQMKVPFDRHTSKSWNEFAQTPVDVVITLCDAAAVETCPVWPGDPITAQWSLPDPAYHDGTDEERLTFAVLVAERLAAKIQAMVALDFTDKRTELKQRLAFLGEI